MNKKEFLEVLRKELTGIPQDDLDERLNFYSEMIDDQTEEGLSEVESVAELGSVDNVVSQIMSEISLVKLVKKRVKPKRVLTWWEIALILLGSPLWLSLLLAVIAVVISLFAALWSIIAALWAAELAVAFSVFALVICGVFFMFTGNVTTGMTILGAGLACAGIAIFGWFGSVAATKGMAVLSKRILVGIKSRFAKKEDVK